MITGPLAILRRGTCRRAVLGISILHAAPRDKDGKDGAGRQGEGQGPREIQAGQVAGGGAQVSGEQPRWSTWGRDGESGRVEKGMGRVFLVFFDERARSPGETERETTGHDDFQTAIFSLESGLHAGYCPPRLVCKQPEKARRHVAPDAQNRDDTEVTRAQRYDPNKRVALRNKRAPSHSSVVEQRGVVWCSVMRLSWDCHGTDWSGIRIVLHIRVDRPRTSASSGSRSGSAASSVLPLPPLQLVSRRRLFL